MKSIIYLGVVFLFLEAGCASSGETNHTVTKSSYNKSKVAVDNPSISLADYLRRVPGVTVQNIGGQVTINVRGATSKYGNTAPLFVVDGKRAGKDYSRVEGLVPASEIKSVEVLKGIDASSAYGLEGSAGVIVIKTKHR